MSHALAEYGTPASAICPCPVFTPHPQPSESAVPVAVLDTRAGDFVLDLRSGRQKQAYAGGGQVDHRGAKEDGAIGAASLYQGGGGQAFPGVTALAAKIDGELRRHAADRDRAARQHSAVPAQWAVNVWQEMGTGGVPWWNAAAYEGPRYRYGTYGAATYHGALREAVGFVRRSAGDGVAIALKGSMPEDHGPAVFGPDPVRRPRDLDVTDPEGAAARLLDGYPADVLDAVQFELKRRREWYAEVAGVVACEADECRAFEDEALVRLFLALAGGES